MSKFLELLKEMEDAENSLEEKKNRLNEFLKPVIAALGVTSGFVSSCWTGENTVYLTLTGSCRGYRWDDDMQIPMSVFESEDPVSEAVKLAELRKQEKENRAREGKMKELERLKKELGES